MNKTNSLLRLSIWTVQMFEGASRLGLDFFALICSLGSLNVFLGARGQEAIQFKKITNKKVFNKLGLSCAKLSSAQA